MYTINTTWGYPTLMEEQVQAVRAHSLPAPQQLPCSTPSLPLAGGGGPAGCCAKSTRPLPCVGRIRGLSRSRVLLRTAAAAAVAPKSTRARTGFPAPESWTGRSMTGSTCRGIARTTHMHSYACNRCTQKQRRHILVSGYGRMVHGDWDFWDERSTAISTQINVCSQHMVLCSILHM